MSPPWRPLSLVIFRPLRRTPLVLPRSAINTQLSLSLITAWKRLTLESLRTGSLAFPRPSVVTGLLSSRMPFFPSGEEMMRRAMEFASLFLEELVEVFDLPLLYLDIAVDGLVPVHLQVDAVNSWRRRPLGIGFLRRYSAVNDDSSSLGNRANVHQALAFGNSVRSQEAAQNVAAVAVFG